MLDKVNMLDVADTNRQDSLGSDTNSVPALRYVALRAIMQIALMLGILVGAGLAMNRLIDARPERSGRPNVSVALPVDAVVAQPGMHQPSIRLFGQVIAAKTIDLRSAVGGEVVSVSDNLVEGLTVSRGDVIFTIDPFDYETALAEAEANLAQQRAAIAENRARIRSEQSQLLASQEQLQFAIDDLERATALNANGTLTDRQIDDRRLLVSQRNQAVTQSQNNLTVEQARLDGQLATERRLELAVQRAARNLQETTVRAPFDGVVRVSNVEVGRIVSASDVVVSMYEEGALDVAFTLTDAQYGRIATDADPLIGRTIEAIWTVGDKPYIYEAVVNRIGADIASDRGGVTVYAQLVPSQQAVDIRPGAFVELKVPDRTYGGAVRVPDTALYGASAMYVVKDGKLERRTVVVAGFDESDVIVASGLAQGDIVMTMRLASVDEGVSVSVPSLVPTSDGADAPAEPSRSSNRSGQ